MCCDAVCTGLRHLKCCQRNSPNPARPAVQGDGFSISSDLQLFDARDGSHSSCIVRPLRDCSRKELALYAHFRQLPFLELPTLPKPGHRESINDLCADFVSTLNVRYFGETCQQLLFVVSRLLGGLLWSACEIAALNNRCQLYRHSS